MIRVLPPWFENVRKRQVKAPKIYIRDSGILHALLQLRTLADLQSHRISGIVEGFALEQVIGALKTRELTSGQPMPAPTGSLGAGSRASTMGLSSNTRMLRRKPLHARRRPGPVSDTPVGHLPAIRNTP